jgi:hypothetical protein
MRRENIPEEWITAIMQGNVRKLNRLFAAREAGPAVILGTIVRW